MAGSESDVTKPASSETCSCVNIPSRPKASICETRVLGSAPLIPTVTVCNTVWGSSPHSMGDSAMLGKPLLPLAFAPWQAAQLSPNSVRPSSRTVRIRSPSDWICARSCLLDPGHPVRAFCSGFFDGFGDLLLLVNAEQPFEIPGPIRPARHQKGPAQREDAHGNEKKVHRSRNWRVEFLDAIPFMPGRVLASEWDHVRLYTWLILSVGYAVFRSIFEPLLVRRPEGVDEDPDRPWRSGRTGPN